MSINQPNDFHIMKKQFKRKMIQHHLHFFDIVAKFM